MKIDPYPTNFGKIDEIAFHANSLWETDGLVIMLFLEPGKLHSFSKEVCIGSPEIEQRLLQSL